MAHKCACHNAWRPQDYSVPTKAIWELWQLHKMTTEHAKRQLLKSRNMGAARLISMLDAHALEEARERTEAELQVTREVIEGSYRQFREHPLLDEFTSQFSGEPSELRSRYKCLLLRGESRSGKTLRALSLFGSENTLSVNCQGCSPALPCIKKFSRDVHDAILWDEVDEQQVLCNKLAFQSGMQQVTLGQSACNAFAYSVYLFRIPMLLCSNTFSMTHSRGKILSQEDRQWLEQNIIEVQLPSGQKWYLEDCES